ncbi:MAG: methionine--tRNA ligase [Bacteroidetes bacterium]|nr:methionine--tRNA ligase [Bacteroidota bacterium]
MSKIKRHLITSALPYANGPLHLGHLAGAYLPADIYVRYLRLTGKEVLWVCGSDEHGAAITIRAKKEGVSPNEIIDKYHTLNKETFEALGISFDYYHRTSEKIHHETSQDFFTTLYEKGDEFIEKVVEQYYDVSFNQFLADRYIKGTCPKCSHTEAFGDQCESCGSTLSPMELIDPKSMLSGETPILKETKHWYFRLDKHADWLKEWIETGTLDGKPHHDPNTWRKHVTGQCLSWLNAGLQPRSITRDLDWGIQVPLDDAKGKVLYVWFDAPIGYISATKQWALENGKDWESYWKGGDDVELIHFIGKDNIVFHCIVFPAMLKAHGDFVLPVNVPANQFLNFEGQKFSKSRGWGLEQHEYLQEFKDFPNKEDALRYALLRTFPENKDSDFKWDEFVDFHDKDLADNLGNFLNRVMVLSHAYFNGVVPKPQSNWEETLLPVLNLVKQWQIEIEKFSFKAASQSFMDLSSWGNIYLQEKAPWSLFKADPSDPKIAEIIFTGLQVSAILSVLAEPFIPFTAKRIHGMLGLSNIPVLSLNLFLNESKIQPFLPPEHQLGTPEVLFPKIIDRKDSSRWSIIEKQKAKLNAIMIEEKEMTQPPLKPNIGYDEFAKLDLRTGVILEAAPVPKADKLLVLKVDLGFEKRTIVSGIALHFKPESLIGKNVVVVANLEPRKLRGIESQGMLLLAEKENGDLVFVGTDLPAEGGWIVK